MKIIHLSDLHIGKRVNEFSMLEDQQYILNEILTIIDEQKADVIIIAGDVYDKSVPSAEAVELFDRFLYRLSKRNLPVMVISGNHDSPERIAFGSGIMCESGIYMSPVYDGSVEPIVLSDSYGRISFYLLPFIKPVHVRRFYENENTESYTDAVRCAVEHMDINPDERNILVTHQFVTGAVRSDSEEVSVGGSDNVDASVFEKFDYVALGHIHGPQRITRDTVRYSGSPLKYSFSEKDHIKSVTVAEIREKGDITINTVPLVPMHDMREIKGLYNELMLKSNYENTATDDYMHIILTDEEDVPDAMSKLRIVYPNLMKLEYDNTRTRSSAIPLGLENRENKSQIEIFEELFEAQNGQPMSDAQRDFSFNLIKDIWGEDI